MGRVSCVALVCGASVRTVTRSPRRNGAPETGTMFAAAFVRFRPLRDVTRSASAASTGLPPGGNGACVRPTDAAATSATRREPTRTRGTHRYIVELLVQQP